MTKNTNRTRVSQKRLKPYPYKVCHPCGIAARNPVARPRDCSSIWRDVCQVCGQAAPVTEARDYGYPTFPGCETLAEAEARYAKHLRDAAREIRKP